MVILRIIIQDLLKNEVNNKVLTEILIRNSVLDDVKGVEMEVTSNDTDFGSHESWNYRDVDLGINSYNR